MSILPRTDVRLQLSQAAEHRRGRRFEACESILRLVLDAEPRNRAALTEFALLAMARREWNNAVDQWKAIVAAFPDLPNRQWLDFAKSLNAVGDFDAAEQIIERVLHKEPDHRVAVVRHAECAACRENWKEAIRRWEKVARIRPDLEARAQRRILTANVNMRNDAQVTTLLKSIYHHDDDAFLASIFPFDSRETKLLSPLGGGHTLAARNHLLQRNGKSLAVFEKLAWADAMSQRESAFNWAYNRLLRDNGVVTPEYFGSVASDSLRSLFFQSLSPVSRTRDSDGEVMNMLIALAKLSPDPGQSPTELVIDFDPTSFRGFPSLIGAVRKLDSDPHALLYLRDRIALAMRGQECRSEELEAFFAEVERRYDRFRDLFSSINFCLTHHDVNRKNVPWCERNQRVFLIDWALGGITRFGYDFGYWFTGHRLTFAEIQSVHMDRILQEVASTVMEREILTFAIYFHYVMIASVLLPKWVAEIDRENFGQAIKWMRRTLAG